MKNFFSEMDDVILTFSDIQTNADGMEYIKLYFERAASADFDYLETELPTLKVKKSRGFSLPEQIDLLEYARDSAFLIWDVAKEREGIA